jgi:D-tagatose-1,6-bisphosphate aldolase subunit GatZ/KbaZ
VTNAESYLRGLSGRRKGEAKGVCSVCSAHPYVVEAALSEALEQGGVALIESTSSQVNQYGGYTGMRPADFRSLVVSLAEKMGFPQDRLILGGDHLGPYLWRGEAAVKAMAEACRLVQDCIHAGFSKIHLDASMRLGGDPDDAGALDIRLAADRTGVLCQAAEEAFERTKNGPYGAQAPVYVIGTEVPAPGGAPPGAAAPSSMAPDNTAQAEAGAPPVTTAEDFEQTVSATREAFHRLGLDSAWKRVIAVVVQLGVEFEDDKVHPYVREKTGALRDALASHPLIFEGHSTDYQEPDALRQMVADGVAILKVGPALTFAMREAIFRLAHIEEDLLDASRDSEKSRLPAVLERNMLSNPGYWQDYYTGDDRQQWIARKYSLLDRSRYYWVVPEVKAALSRLVDNLRKNPPPLGLLSQFFPALFGRVRRKELPNDPEALIKARIREVLRDYPRATWD